jgi:hypothetical protein
LFIRRLAKGNGGVRERDDLEAELTALLVRHYACRTEVA